MVLQLWFRQLQLPLECVSCLRPPCTSVTLACNQRPTFAESRSSVRLVPLSSVVSFVCCFPVSVSRKGSVCSDRLSSHSHRRLGAQRGWPGPSLGLGRLGGPGAPVCYWCSAQWPRAWSLPPQPYSQGSQAAKTPPQIFRPGEQALCLFSSEIKHLEDFFFLKEKKKALSFRRNLGMLLLKEKKCLQCISHPFSSEHDLCEEMVFLKN